MPGLIDLIPTMIMGTILPSPSSFEFPAGSNSRGASSGRRIPEPNLNILKKFSGAGDSPPVSMPSEFSFPVCLSADAILPFCNACKKLSKVPSSPSPATFRASETALWSSPISEAAVAAAATESSLESIAA